MKNKIDKKTLILTTLVAVLPIIAALIMWDKIPDVVATHWDAHGNVNGTSSKFIGTIVFPGGMALLTFAMPFLLSIDPKYSNTSSKLRTAVQWFIPAVSLVCSIITLAAALGISLPVAKICISLIGLLILVIGNYLPKTKQSYTVGIRVPWTLNSEDNWNKTHRFGGFLWVIGGIIMIFCAFIPYGEIVFVICLFVITLAPIVYSYVYYRKHGDKETDSE